jgi:Asp/Glu/hydantoin racemase
MIKDILTSAAAFARLDTKIVCVNLDKGPVTIEGSDEKLIAPLRLIKALLKFERDENIDAYLIAHFGDPGIYHDVRSYGSRFHSRFRMNQDHIDLQIKDRIEKGYLEAIILGCSGITRFVRMVQKKKGYVSLFIALALAVKITEAPLDLCLTSNKMLSYK